MAADGARGTVLSFSIDLPSRIFTVREYPFGEYAVTPPREVGKVYRPRADCQHARGRSGPDGRHDRPCRI
jgi:hypothetical protein